jgi:hypothetical protein
MSDEMSDVARGSYSLVPDSRVDRCKDEADQCSECGAALPTRSRAVTVCDRRECQRSLLGDAPVAMRRAIARELRASLTARAEGTPGISRPTIALVPANVRPMEPVSDAARASFAATLRSRVGNGIRDESHDADVAGDAEPLQPIFAIGCAVCGGACCTRGGTHAFLSSSDFRRVANSTTNGDTGTPLEALYNAHIPDWHYAGSCLFHGAQGCTLPRSLRSATCNRYLCGGLSTLRRSMMSAETDTVVIGAAAWSHLERAAVVDVTVTPPEMRPLNLD